jgi:hypothetical protein
MKEWKSNESCMPIMCLSMIVFLYRLAEVQTEIAIDGVQGLLFDAAWLPFVAFARPRQESGGWVTHKSAHLGSLRLCGSLSGARQLL